MAHFNLKSLAFYGVAIGSVLLLFKVVTAYGESNLKAPRAINSRYRLVLSENLPICEKTDSLMLNIQQSGIYLNGFLRRAFTNAEISTAIETNPTLTGRLNNQQLSLSGKVPRSILCNTLPSQIPANSRPQDNSFTLVKIEIQLVDKGDFTGQINVSGTSRAIGFTATPQKADKQSENSNSH